MKTIPESAATLNDLLFLKGGKYKGYNLNSIMEWFLMV
jgi:hypothetical protein